MERFQTSPHPPCKPALSHKMFIASSLTAKVLSLHANVDSNSNLPLRLLASCCSLQKERVQIHLHSPLFTENPSLTQELWQGIMRGESVVPLSATSFPPSFLLLPADLCFLLFLLFNGTTVCQKLC